MTRIRAILTLLRRGHAVADPAAWKRRHITVAALAGLLVAFSQALEVFGYGHFFPVDADAAAVLAAAVLVVADLVLVPATTEKVGLPTVGDDPPAQPAKPATRNDRPAQDEHYLG
jgi:peptidoglycan/LPS O-acetylase OafA/YrhL